MGEAVAAAVLCEAAAVGGGLAQGLHQHGLRVPGAQRVTRGPDLAAVEQQLAGVQVEAVQDLRAQNGGAVRLSTLSIPMHG